MIKAFVYGTLMQGLWNHRFLEGQRQIGKASLYGYRMYNVSSFPGIVESKSADQPINGELYEIDERCLMLLDRLEGEGRLYKRVAEKVITKDGQEHTAFVYVWLGKVHSNQIVKETPWKPSRCMVY